MSISRSFTRLAAATLALGFLSACPLSPAAAEATESAAALVLAVYDVPAGQAEVLASAVNGVLYRANDAKIGSARVGPSGQLLVAAPAGVQQGVADLVARMKRDGVAASPSLALDAWIVMGTPAAEVTAGASVAREIGDVLDELQSAQGPMKLTLVEHARVLAQSGARGRVEGRNAALESNMTLQGDVAAADLTIERKTGRMNVRAYLPLGKVVVLGQAGVPPEEAAGATGQAVTAFYVVRASAPKG